MWFTMRNITRSIEGGSRTIPLLLRLKHWMKEMAAAHGLTGKSCGTVQNALATAKKEADADDFILVFGSCYVVGEVV